MFYAEFWSVYACCNDRCISISRCLWLAIQSLWELPRGRLWTHPKHEPAGHSREVSELQNPKVFSSDRSLMNANLCLSVPLSVHLLSLELCFFISLSGSLMLNRDYLSLFYTIPPTSELLYTSSCLSEESKQWNKAGTNTRRVMTYNIILTPFPSNAYHHYCLDSPERAEDGCWVIIWWLQTITICLSSPLHSAVWTAARMRSEWPRGLHRVTQNQRDSQSSVATRQPGPGLSPVAEYRGRRAQFLFIVSLHFI